MSEISNIYELHPEDVTHSMVILLHGLGSNGRDLISLAPMWADALPNTVFISPDAPFPCDMVPTGYPDSFQWFSLQDRDPDKILAGISTAAPILDKFIHDQLKKYQLTTDRLVLCGFSQGTMMSLYSGTRLEAPLAGILGYSGAMFGNAGPQQCPVHLVHGEADDVVPVDAYHEARKELQEKGFDVSGHSTPNLQHSIDEKGINSGKEFLISAFK